MNKSTLYKISYGLYVVSSVKDGKYNGQIANTVFQITSEPTTIAVSINKQNLTHEYIEASRIFAASILSTEASMQFIGHFGFRSGRDIDKFDSISFKVGSNGCPVVLDYALGYIEADVVEALDVGTHTIFVGRVADAEIVDSESEPMTYAYYQQARKGKAPKTAPTYIAEENPIVEETRKEAGNMDKYECTLCGWVYDPEQGDPDSGIDPGIPFENLPDDWVCPVCGAGKDQFKKI
jgi:flavin reductase (DIM6/NTAB) family NADH-FMN oxidoreductase RutF/rubredoxin